MGSLCQFVGGWAVELFGEWLRFLVQGAQGAQAQSFQTGPESWSEAKLMGIAWGYSGYANDEAVWWFQLVMNA